MDIDANKNQHIMKNIEKIYIYICIHMYTYSAKVFEFRPYHHNYLGWLKATLVPRPPEKKECMLPTVNHEAMVPSWQLQSLMTISRVHRRRTTHTFWKLSGEMYGNELG